MGTAVERFWQKVDRAPGQGPRGDCWLWIGALNDSGYGKLTANGSKAYRAHRFSYELENGPLAAGACVLHRCDTRRCVRPDHLFEGTRSENNADTKSKGRSRGGQGKGSAHPRAVLNEHYIKLIWFFRGRGHGASAIGRMLQLNRRTVQNVLSGNSWSHYKERGFGVSADPPLVY